MEDNIREWTGLEFGKSQRAVENGKMEETGRKEDRRDKGAHQSYLGTE